MNDKLAKLLATENIIVEQRKVVTASFDVKTRTLTLPIWKDVTEELECLLTGHEVGHALYTPADGLINELTNNRKIKHVLNVVEDPRIERKIKNKYPGLRRDFFEGYKNLHERDFFNLKGRDIASIKFIDRLNIHFKIGAFLSVPFSEEELQFVELIENTVTWNDVVKVSNKLYGYILDKIEEGEEESFDINEDDLGEFEFDSEDMGEESDEGDDDGEFSDRALNQDQLVSDTMESMESNISSNMIDPSCRDIKYIDVYDYDATPWIITSDEMLYAFRKEVENFFLIYPHFKGYVENTIESHKDVLWNSFLKKNNKSIMYMVKEFEVKKAADSFVRSKESKTGTISPNKLHSYKLAEDIFRKITVIPESKNHGLFMLVDFSGSMNHNIKGTIEQLLCLVMFCRKVNIPHRVYAFTNQKFDSDYFPSENNKRITDYCFEGLVYREIGYHVSPYMRLIEMFTEKMNNKKFTELAKRWISASHFMSGNYEHKHCCHNIITLNSTPLNDAIVLSRSLISNFKKTTNAQIVNTVILTDGESDPSNIVDSRENILKKRKAVGDINETISSRIEPIPYQSRSDTDLIIRDCQTKKDYKVPKKYDNILCRHTHILVSMLKDRTGSDTICYRIESNSREIKSLIARENDKDNLLRGGSSYLPFVDDAYKKFRKNGFLQMKNFLGFQSYFVMSGGSKLDTEESLIEDKIFDSKNQVAKAFIKAQNNRGASRVMLSRFIDKISIR